MTLEERIQDLTAAVRDVLLGGSEGPVRSIAVARAEHRSLFNTYVRELREAKKNAESWWQGLIDSEESRIGNRHEAETNVRLRRPAGYVVHPGVIDTIRRFWLGCLRTNDTLPTQDRVAPETFVLRWLEQEGEHDLADFVSALPYWPMGMDEQGKWI
jgi:hypothetical protein